METAATLDLFAHDVTGQKKFRLGNVSLQSSVGEIVRGALAGMGLGSHDRQGHELEYRARLKRDGGRQLHNSELVGDTLKSGDEIVLTPRINAG